MMTKSQSLKNMDAAFEELAKQYRLLREQFLVQNYDAKSNWCIGVSAGHSDMDPETGIYITPDKRFQHKGLKLHTDDGWFYEGVWNRVIAEKFVKRLKECKMVYQKFYHPYKDMSLREKSDWVNRHHANIKKVLLFELHGNASPKHNAQGFSVFTSPGQTDSDKLATILWEKMAEFSDDFGFKMRKQSYNDGDVDYEAGFWMCTKTACPAILPECLFFDFKKDVRIMMNEKFQDAYVEALLFTAMWGNANL